MQSLINHLNQLQDLVLTRDEHRQTGDGSHLDSLNDSIDELVEKLPPDVRSHWQLLSKRDHVVMSPMYNGSCSVCGMRLPIAQVQAVRMCKTLQNCPSCTRILFEENDAPQWIGERPSRNAPRKSGVSRFSAPSLMIPALKATNGAEAITELAQLMEEMKFISRSDRLIQNALEREAILSTAMENGIAFPHVRGVEGGGLTFALGISKEGIPFDEDGTIVNIIFLITIPSAVSAFYLRLMSMLTETFIKEQHRQALLASENQDQLWKALTKATRYCIK
ncbi:MAG: PTS sugar transporter subunit IIA [Kiritimatiellae bacterium]|nr:PTS sugar transporter subunit IIA [Kiritimatiellia bacterium]